MSVTTVAVPTETESSPGRTVRLVFAALAIAVLLAGAFALGRATMSGSDTSSIVPVAHTQSITDSCPRLRYC